MSKPTLAELMAAASPVTAKSSRCACCKAIAGLDDDAREQLLAILRGEVRHPHRDRPFYDREVGAFLGVTESQARDCRAQHYGIRRVET